MDLDIRHLERLALQGDPAAQQSLIVARSRAGLCCGGTGWSGPFQRCVCQIPPSEEEADSWRAKAKTRIDTLFPEELLAHQRDRWIEIGLATGPTDRNLAIAGINLAYKAAKVKIPKNGLEFFWLPNPVEGTKAASQLAKSKKAGDQVETQVWRQVRTQVGDQVYYQVGTQVWDQVWNQVGAQVGVQVWDQVGVQVWNQVWNQVGAQVLSQVWNAWYGSQNAEWLSNYDLYSLVGIRAADKLRGQIWAAQATGWWWPFEKAVIITERPSLITPTQIIYPGNFVVNRI